ncbi:hypothetical protein J6590_008701 [Homalodisca vitripennis]|nr:hypothetical protein J6590_008701 [Homalodisca vitripennis]
MPCDSATGETLPYKGGSGGNHNSGGVIHKVVVSSERVIELIDGRCRVPAPREKPLPYKGGSGGVRGQALSARHGEVEPRLDTYTYSGRHDVSH